jgi:hypothetical protein
MIAEVGEQLSVLRKPLGEPGAVCVIELCRSLGRRSFGPGHDPRLLSKTHPQRAVQPFPMTAGVTRMH